ncbi:MAG TPA: S41 family peptidase [Flavobacteriales bacterium]|nr:S41 family peptidase [Flavobacteriales bacterium]
MRGPHLISCLALSLVVRAQDTCSCTRNLDLFISKVERNYAGYQDKVTETTRPHYAALVDSVKRMAVNEQDKSRCFELLDTYRAFFRDKHLQLAGAHASNDDGSVSTPPRTTTWTAAALEGRFGNRNEMPRPLEGAWSLDAYRVGIVYNDSLRAYDAIIMASENPNWKEGMVKFTVTEPVNGACLVRYWRGDLHLIEVQGTWATGHLAMTGVGTWHMTEPPAGTMDASAFELAFGSEVQWKMLDDTTLYIKLGSCDLSNKAVLDSLVNANKTALDRIPNWIVDFRGNGGGSTDVFQALVPYLYTKPYKEHGVSHWMSPENTTLLKAWLEENMKVVDARTARYITKWVRYGEKHPNTWHKGSGGTTRLRKHDMPRRVAILADRGTASSGESFLELARGMSDKSVIFGENTGGFMDYGDLQPHDLGCDGLVAAIPTSRMNRLDHGLRYDLEGIAPDVRVGHDVTDWIAVVRRYWEQ